MPKPIKETATFRIKNGDTTVSLKVEGSTVGALIQAFTFLSPERRLKVLERMQAKQAALLEAEALRTQNTLQTHAQAQGDQP